MKIDCTVYYETLNKCKHYLITNRAGDIHQTISELSVFTGVPLIAVIVFALATLGHTNELEQLETKIKNFYGYTEIIK